MSTLYFLALCGVCLVMLALIGDAIISVSRQPAWSLVQPARPALQVVDTVERREQPLPYVGAERRVADAQAVDPADAGVEPMRAHG